MFIFLHLFFETLSSLKIQIHHLTFQKFLSICWDEVFIKEITTEESVYECMDNFLMPKTQTLLILKT